MAELPIDLPVHYPGPRKGQDSSRYLCGESRWTWLQSGSTSWVDGTNWTWVLSRVTCDGCRAGLAVRALQGCSIS